MRAIVVAALGMMVSQWAMADAVVLEKDGAATHRHAKAGSVKAGDKRSGVRVGSSPAATGSIALIDGSGMKYFINTNITFSTSSSASAAMSEASYTHAVALSPQKASLNMAHPPIIFDRSLLRARRSRAAALGPVTFLIDRVAEDMADRLGAVLRRFEQAADLGTPTAAVRRALAGKVGEITEVTLDDEALPLREASLDLVVSGLALQFVNDLPGVLLQARRALRPDGLMLAALVGGDSLTELRGAFAAAEADIEDGASPRVAPFADLRDLGALLQRAGFALPVTDIDRVTVRYASPLDLMHDLRRMGATNALVERQRKPLRRATLRRMLEIYAERFAAPDGRVPATFEIVWVSGWAPDASQQQPLRPGSAKTRLADALRTTEISTGEKTGR